MKTPQYSKACIMQLLFYRVQKSMVQNPVRGNCGRKRRLFQTGTIADTLIEYVHVSFSKLFIDMCVCMCMCVFECLISVSYRENAHNHDYLLPLRAFLSPVDFCVV